MDKSTFVTLATMAANHARTVERLNVHAQQFGLPDAAEHLTDLVRRTTLTMSTHGWEARIAYESDCSCCSPGAIVWAEGDSPIEAMTRLVGAARDKANAEVANSLARMHETLDNEAAAE